MVLTTSMIAAPRLREARRELGRLWWIPLLSGIAWLILAWVLLSFDVTTVWTVAVFAAIFMFYGGVIEMTIAAVTPSWRWVHVLLAVAFIAAGVTAVAWPDVTFLALAAIISWMIMVAGVFDIVTAIEYRSLDELWWLTLIVGLAEVIVGLWAIGYAGNAIVLMVVWLAAIAIARGITSIVLALQVRHLTDEPRLTEDLRRDASALAT